MIDFVDTSLSLRIALHVQVAVATMHFHMAQTGLLMGNCLSHSGGLSEQFGTNSKLSLGCNVGQIRS